jgi:hypothetical protein
VEAKRDYGKSNEEGNFTLYGFMPGGTVFVRATQGPELSGIEGPWKLTQENLTDVVVRVVPGTKLSGVLVDKNGTPVANTQVAATYLRENFPVNNETNEQGAHYMDVDQKPSVTTLVDGTFEVACSMSGIYGIQASPPSSKDAPSPYFTQILKRVVVHKGENIRGLRIVLGQPEESGLAIAGNIRDPEGKPLAEVRVDATIIKTPPEFVGSCGYSEADGTFRIVGLSEGEYVISGRLSGYVGGDRPSISAGSDGIELVLSPAASIRGRVVAASSGDSITDYRVTRWRGEMEYSSGMSDMGISAKMDADGVFAFDEVESGDLTLFASAPGYVVARKVLSDVQPGQSLDDVVIQLELGEPIEGIVVDTAGNPVPGAKVFEGSVQVDMQEIGLDKPVAVAHHDGTFRVERQSPPPWNDLYAAYTPGYAVGAAKVSQDGSNARHVRIVLEKGGGTIEGRVTVSGARIADPSIRIRVSIYYPDTLVGHLGEAKYGNDGSYEFANAPSGQASLTAELELPSTRGDSRALTRDAHVENGKVTVENFDFAELAGTLSGTVFLNNAPNNYAWVSTHWQTPSGETQRATAITDTSGAYSLAGLPVGNIEVEVSGNLGPGKRTQNTFSVTIDESGTTQQDFALGEESE